MKKLLIATAAFAMVAGTAQAQSSVTVYGILDMGYVSESKKTQSATATTDVTGINTGAGLSGNRIGFRGTEDLGGGLTAGFVYELGITPENSTTLHSPFHQRHFLPHCRKLRSRKLTLCLSRM